MLSRFLTSLIILLSLAFPARAAPVDDVMTALRIDQMLEIMREEGLEYGQDLGSDMFAAGENPRWDALLRQIYDTDKMRTIVRAHFEVSLADTDTDVLVTYFGSEIGQQIVQLEMDARRALIDETVEDAARDAYRTAGSSEKDRIAQLKAFIETNNLIEANVEGALNASFQFYRGLVDGGGLEMTESEIITDVWSQEGETRDDTVEWLYAFLLLAYEPLTDEQLKSYIDISASPEGRDLNRALFSGFNKMYDEISYALGLAAAQQMQGQDL